MSYVVRPYSLHMYCSLATGWWVRLKPYLIYLSPQVLLVIINKQLTQKKRVTKV